MPHKKNPDVFELIRARCNALQALPNTLMLATSNLPSGYHRDFQILKEILFEPMTQFLDILDIVLFALPQLRIKPDLLNQPKYDAVFSVENINQLIQAGVPFREAYKQVGRSVEDGTYQPHREFTTTHLGSVHNLGLAEIRAKVARFQAGSNMTKQH